MGQKDEFITVSEAKEKLDDKAYFAFHKWLVLKGYRNLNDKYVTRDQLQEFIKENNLSVRGDLSIGALFGQTREYLRGGSIKK